MQTLAFANKEGSVGEPTPPRKFNLARGDLIEVRTAEEIVATLAVDGSLDGLPFMPEMLGFCGKRYRVFQRAVQVVIDTSSLRPAYTESFVRGFKNEDVVLLEGLRCAGLAHGGCERGCTLFWKEAWLRKVEGAPRGTGPSLNEGVILEPELRTLTAPGVYVCQSSEILKSTQHLTGLRRLRNWLEALRVGNYGVVELIRHTAVWAYWKVRRKLFGQTPHGVLSSTPAETLELQPGELVQVKSLAEIVQTLDREGRNRGMHFTPDMTRHCGKQYRVHSRADHLIAEGTGKMRQLRNTVTLEGVICDDSYFAFGGCPRSDFQYWREIWLKRIEAPAV